MTAFSKILGKTDTSKTLSVPTKSLKSLPSFKAGHAVDFQAIDESGFVWTFKFSIRKKGQFFQRAGFHSSAIRSLKLATRSNFPRTKPLLQHPLTGLKLKRKLRYLVLSLAIHPSWPHFHE
ncbi:hypothetical protein NC651_028155 [Populus alba x Populus x berolinensis]|nr:hypothetical protein NC651_028155 [Populus alba x Populus x berolinensis]